jgi:hypothetical protein
MAASSSRERVVAPIAGGIWLTLGVCIGVSVGVALDEPTVGTLTGAAIGVALAVLTALVDRRRRRNGSER